MARQHRFLASKVTKGGFVFIQGREAYHARNILRLKPADRIVVFDTKGNEFEAEILRFHSKEKIEAKILKKIERNVEMTTKLHLFLGLCRAKNFELAIQKCAEIGVFSITPLQTDYSILKTEDAEKKVSRWEKIVIDAAKQSSRITVPKINAPMPFDDLNQHLGLNKRNTLFATISKDAIPLRDVVKNLLSSDGIYIIIGPEGGFSPRENQYAQENGWNLVKLGERILRAETAAIFIVSILCYKFD